ncbi:hypothetical protein TNCT_148821 [Trichonephila clavata]|uniref:Uncharacterized protein n=1 Tax=Trichonephila clavata TaxID=2740835 RepID=A0A8X6H562_TRICU|nr:hypothetical protein TNCT_148821 [Trichonephila clavata]
MEKKLNKRRRALTFPFSVFLSKFHIVHVAVDHPPWRRAMSTARPFPKHLTWSPGVRFREAGWSGCAVPLEKKRGSRCNRGAIYWRKYLAERLAMIDLGT